MEYRLIPIYDINILVAATTCWCILSSPYSMVALADSCFRCVTFLKTSIWLTLIVDLCIPESKPLRLSVWIRKLNTDNRLDWVYNCRTSVLSRPLQLYTIVMVISCTLTTAGSCGSQTVTIYFTRYPAYLIRLHSGPLDNGLMWYTLRISFDILSNWCLLTHKFLLYTVIEYFHRDNTIFNTP